MRLGSFRITILDNVRAALFGRRADPFAELVARHQAKMENFRSMLPDHCATAGAIDRDEPWDKIAQCAVDDGYVDFAEELSRYVEACLRRNG